MIDLPTRMFLYLGIQQFPTVSNIPPTSFNPADLDVTKRINPRGPPQRPIPTRGGQLEVAGIVVGNWGPNYSLSRPKLAMPQVCSDYFSIIYKRRQQRLWLDRRLG